MVVARACVLASLHLALGCAVRASDLPRHMKGLVEYAKSARAACRKCSSKIEKGSLRLGYTEKSSGGFDATRWFHPACYFKDPGIKAKGTPSPADLAGYSSLKAADKATLSSLAEKVAETQGEEEEEERRNEEEESRVQLAAAEERVNTLLTSFTVEKAPRQYKDVALPHPWRAFQTVIFHAGEGVEARERIAAFDFDGCLANTDVRIMGADKWKLQFPCVPAKLREYHSQGFKLVVFTNEATIDRHTKQRKKAVDSKLGRLNAFLLLLGAPAQVFVSCATNGSKDPFRKPAPGMWRMMEHLNGGTPVDLQQSFFVGDAAGREQDHSDADIGFARNVGVRFMLPEDVFSE